MKLNAWNMSDGTVEIHKAGCSHNPASGRKSSRMQDQVEFGQTDWASQFEFAHDYWDNGILDENPDMDVFVEMDFKPCVTLPIGRPAVAKGVAGKAEEAATRKPLEVRREAREALFYAMRSLMNDTPEGEVKQMMIEQASRVAVMFGLHHEAGFSVLGN